MSKLTAPLTEAQSLLEAFIKDNNIDRDKVKKSKLSEYVMEGDQENYGYDIKGNQVMFYTWGLPEDHAWTKFINEQGYSLDIF